MDPKTGLHNDPNHQEPEKSGKIQGLVMHWSNGHHPRKAGGIVATQWSCPSRPTEICAVGREWAMNTNDKAKLARIVRILDYN